MEMNMQDFIKRAAEKCGFLREKYVESKLPTHFSAFMAIPFFGDKKHEFVLASMLLHRLKEKYNKYLILCGWPGHASFFPSADEYWGLKDEGSVKIMLPQAQGWGCQDNRFKFYDQQLSRHFDTLSVSDLQKYYANGLTSQFFDDFKFVLYNLPEQPGVKADFLKLLSSRQGYKVLVYPTRKIDGWRRGRLERVSCRVEFWEKLLEKMLVNGFLPVVYADEATYDLSPKFADRCMFFTNQKLLDVFAVMRSCGCVLDVFSGISRWAVAARTPFVYLTERHMYFECKEYEIDDLCANQLPYRYIFSYTTMIEGVDYISLVDTIISKLKNFVPEIDRNHLPNTSELSVVSPYLMVRQHKAKRFGTKFFKIQKI